MHRVTRILSCVALALVGGTLAAPTVADACSCMSRREYRKLPKSERGVPPATVFYGRVLATEEVYDCAPSPASENFAMVLPTDGPPVPTEGTCVELRVAGACGQPLSGTIVWHPRGGALQTDARGVATLCGVAAGDEVRLEHNFVYHRTRLSDAPIQSARLQVPEPDLLRHTFRVTFPLRGARVLRQVVVTSPGGSCGFHPQPRGFYYVRADGELLVPACSRSRAVWPTRRMHERRRQRRR